MDSWLPRLTRSGLIPSSISPTSPGGWRERGPVPTGFLTLSLFDLYGGLLHRVVHQNVVTNLGRHAIAHTTAGDDVANQRVTSIVFGSGVGTPDVTDVALFSAVIITKTVTASFPAVSPPTEVTYTASVLAGEGNGSGSQDYKEAGLLTSAGSLFSHTAGFLISKTSAIVITAAWSLVF